MAFQYNPFMIYYIYYFLQTWEKFLEYISFILGIQTLISDRGGLTVLKLFVRGENFKQKKQQQPTKVGHCSSLDRR